MSDAAESVLIDQVRAALDEEFARGLGSYVTPDEAERFVAALARRGVSLVDDTDDVAPAELDLGPGVVVNVNVTTDAAGLGAVLDAIAERGAR